MLHFRAVAVGWLHASCIISKIRPCKVHTLVVSHHIVFVN